MQHAKRHRQLRGRQDSQQAYHKAVANTLVIICHLVESDHRTPTVVEVHLRREKLKQDYKFRPLKTQHATSGYAVAIHHYFRGAA